MENQQNQGAILQERMRERIKQMDTHSLHTSSQVCNVLQVNGVIDKMETEHGRAVMELEDMIASHQGLAHKLQEECKRVGTHLENTSNRYK